ncbi:MAG: acyltransferase family protein [Thermoleophilia bacterium]
MPDRTTPTTPPGSPSRLPYMPGVDGLRALAVLAVVGYHAGASWLPGGFLGVDVFLVISGFLITSLLLSERASTGRIDLRRFWVRRARRLLPAVVVMIAVVLAAMLVLHPGEVGGLRGAVVSSLLYVGNWYQIAVEQSYFEQFARPSVLQHLWSLAVEEQFYLLWPPIMAACIAVLGRRRLLIGVLAGILASTVAAAVLWAPGTDPSRIYYGTDTRAAGLLAGVALAFLWPAARLARAARRSAPPALDGIGLAALALLLLLLGTVGEMGRFLYQGGFLVTAIVSAVLLAVVCHPASRLGRALAWAPLVWIGVRSYGIYLWHWPVLMLTRPGRDVPFDGPALVALQLGLTVALAWASYRWVETPIRRDGFGVVWTGLRQGLRRDGDPRRRWAISATVATTAVVAVLVAVLPASTPGLPGIPPSVSALGPQGASAAGSVPEAETEAVAEAAPARAPRGPVLAVGDSVLLGAQPQLTAAFGRRLSLDATVARQFPESAAAARAAVAALSPAVLVLHVGTNGTVDQGDLENLLDGFSAVPVIVLVTVRVSQPWQDGVNEVLRAAASGRVNVALADWHGLTEGRPDLLADTAHATPEGARLLAGLLKRTARSAGGSATGPVAAG